MSFRSNIFLPSSNVDGGDISFRNVGSNALPVDDFGSCCSPTDAVTKLDRPDLTDYPRVSQEELRKTTVTRNLASVTLPELLIGFSARPPDIVTHVSVSFLQSLPVDAGIAA
jgi:hypothetical protein